MPRLLPDSPEVSRIDGALAKWQQGDVVRGTESFIHIGDPARPLTELAGKAEGDGPTVLIGEEVGLIVLTQTCDLVRTCIERPFVEVAPIVKVEDAKLPQISQIEKGYFPRYAYIPALQGEHLIADLDRVMTIEKAIVADWVRILGCRNDTEMRAFATALKRKRGRIAFPDDFVVTSKRLTNRLKDKHDKTNEEGCALRALREIRVTASPSWGAECVNLTFWFIREKDQPTFEDKAWSTWLEAWLKLVAKTDRYAAIDGTVTTLADMTAEDYVTSDPLDLDYLSLRGEPVG